MDPFGFGNSQTASNDAASAFRARRFHPNGTSAKVRGISLTWRTGFMTEHNDNPLHGVTLEQILNALVQHYEWSGLAERIDIRCFKSDPSIKSSLTFLRKTPWAREKVERLYIKLMRTKRPV
jgi:hypothetical protein